MKEVLHVQNYKAAKNERAEVCFELQYQKHDTLKYFITFLIHHYCDTKDRYLGLKQKGKVTLKNR